MVCASLAARLLAYEIPLRSFSDLLMTYVVTWTLSFCKHEKAEVAFLSHTNTANGICPVTCIEAVCKFTVPQEKKALHQLIGLIIYYHRFVPSCVEIDCLYTKPSLPTVLQGPPAFNVAKSSLLQAVTLVYPHANTGTCITTEASNFAVGAVLE